MREIVVNTGPIIALVAATGSLNWLTHLYEQVWIPFEVEEEISAGGHGAPERRAISSAEKVIRKLPRIKKIAHGLENELDLGEASVIHTALEKEIELVAIDEKAGRRVARVHGLQVTGSVGILIKAKKHGLIESLTACVQQMQSQGIWISESIVNEALRVVDELPDGEDL